MTYKRESFLDDCKVEYEIFYGDIDLPQTWGADIWAKTFREQMKAGYRKSSTHRDSAPNYMLGSTAGVTGNKFKFTTREGAVEYLPRLNSCSRIGGAGATILARQDTLLLAQQAHDVTLEWAKECDSSLHATLMQAMEVIPAELRIAGTFWTAFTLVGNLEDGCNHLHVDSNDTVSLIIQMGTKVAGGATVYYGGGSKFKKATTKKPGRGRETRGTEVHRREHHHGQFQVTDFAKVVHEGEGWRGERGIISFYLNKQILEHFVRHGNEYFDMHRATCLYGSPRVPAWRSTQDNEPRKRPKTVRDRMSWHSCFVPLKANGSIAQATASSSVQRCTHDGCDYQTTHPGHLPRCAHTSGYDPPRVFHPVVFVLGYDRTWCRRHMRVHTGIKVPHDADHFVSFVFFTVIIFKMRAHW
jgi:hypothetical protein